MSYYYSIFRVKGSARFKTKNFPCLLLSPYPCYYVAGRQATAEARRARIIDDGEMEDVKKKIISRYRRKGERERESVSRNVVQRKEKSKCSVPFGFTDGSERGELIIDFSGTMSFLRLPFIVERLAPTDFPRSVIGFINCPLIENSE